MESNNSQLQRFKLKRWISETSQCRFWQIFNSKYIDKATAMCYSIYTKKSLHIACVKRGMYDGDCEKSIRKRSERIKSESF